MPRNPELPRELNLQCITAINEFEKFRDGVIPIVFIEEWLKSNHKSI